MKQVNKKRVTENIVFLTKNIVFTLVLVILLATSAAAQAVGTIEDDTFFDKDDDGFTYFQDCRDNTVGQPATCAGIAASQCSNPIFSHCPICINPAATEVGDGVDNNCDGLTDPMLPAGWIQAAGPQYPNFGRNKITTVNQKVRFNDDTSLESFGITSQKVPVIVGQEYTAGVTLSACSATVRIAIESWRQDGSKGSILAETTGQSGTLTLQTQAIPLGTTHLSLLIHTTQTSTGLCDADDPFLIQGVGTPKQLQANALPASCCAPGACWDGIKCIANQAQVSADITTEGLRCLNGVWQRQDYKVTPDRGLQGFCPRSDQCLFNPAASGSAALNDQPETFFTNINQPRCIANEQYILDDLCTEGNWSTRTRDVALHLLAYAKEQNIPSYTLFCDEPETVLQTTLDRSDTVFDTTCQQGSKTVPCTNNICILAFGDKFALGTSLNVPVNKRAEGFLEQIGLSRSLCDNVQGTEFRKCGDFTQNQVAQSAWYNSGSNSIIIIPQGSITEQTRLQAFTTYIKQRLQPIMQFIFGGSQPLHVQDQTDLSFFGEATDFDKIFVLETPQKKAFAFYQEEQFTRPKTEAGSLPRDFIGVKYENFNVGTDPCNFFLSEFPGTQCRVEQGKLLLVAHREHTETQRGDLLDAWKDITAKLRVS